MLQPGRNMVAAGYVLYSSSVVMMISAGRGVYGFTLDPNYGEFIMSHNNLTIPKEPKQIYSINGGNSELWDDATKAFIRWTKSQKSAYSSRYIGSMVSDVHRFVLLARFNHGLLSVFMSFFSSYLLTSYKDSYELMMSVL